MATSPSSPSTTSTQVTVPMITAFTPPAECFTNPPLYLSGLLEFNDILSGPSSVSKCYPSGFPSVVYSPGVCPSGFEAQSLSTGKTVTSGGEHQEVCCMRSVTYLPTYIGICPPADMICHVQRHWGSWNRYHFMFTKKKRAHANKAVTPCPAGP